MAIRVMIIGESGTGKTASIMNMDPATTLVVNPCGKPLPFRTKFRTLDNVTDAEDIKTWVYSNIDGVKSVVIDDLQYVLAFPYMDRIKESGWDKFNDFGSNYFSLLEFANKLPDDVIVYYLTHCETLESGVTCAKLLGKLLREKITVEGMFTVVLRTGVSEGSYFFQTQNSGKDTVKSPMGMFDSYAIRNDLAYVDENIRNYYALTGAKSDEELRTASEAAAVPEVEKPQRTHRTRRSGAEPVKDAANVTELVADPPKPFTEELEKAAAEPAARARRRRSHDAE